MEKEEKEEEKVTVGISFFLLRNQKKQR